MTTDDASPDLPISTWGTLAPAVRGGGFNDPDYWTWCGSVIEGDDGRFHMFSSRWSTRYGFHHWSTRSEVVRAVSDTPEGPYEFQEVVLPERGAEFWDGRATHNPTIHRHGDTYLLFYTGITYPFDPPQDTTSVSMYEDAVSLHSKQIGIATAPSPEGPWTRMDAPILSPRPDGWDNYFVSNAAPVVHDDGSVLLVYKGMRGTLTLDDAATLPPKEWWQYTDPAHNLFLGVARAEHWSGPYERLSDDAIMPHATIDLGRGIEDPYTWWNGRHYELVCKDMTGEICGTVHGGMHAWSLDGVAWELYDPPLAYTRTLRWDDGVESVQGQVERCELLIEDGKPRYMFAATGDGPGGFGNMTHSFNVCIPFERGDD